MSGGVCLEVCETPRDLALRCRDGSRRPVVHRVQRPPSQLRAVEARQHLAIATELPMALDRSGAVEAGRSCRVHVAGQASAADGADPAATALLFLHGALPPSRRGSAH